MKIYNYQEIHTYGNYTKNLNKKNQKGHNGPELLICACESCNSLPKDKILDWSKLKVFADDNIRSAKIKIFVFDRVENIVGKGVNCGLPAFSPFPSILSKGLVLKVVKSQDCVVGC